jgi:hypothetical protein
MVNRSTIWKLVFAMLRGHLATDLIGSVPFAPVRLWNRQERLSPIFDRFQIRMESETAVIRLEITNLIGLKVPSPQKCGTRQNTADSVEFGFSRQ